MLLDQPVIAGLEVGQKNVTDAKAIPAGLVHVGRTYAAQSRPNFVLALLLFVGGIQQTVGRQNQVRLARDEQPRVHIHPMVLDLHNLTLQSNRVNDHAIANQVLLAFVENTARNGVQYVLSPIKFQGMTGIGAALKAGYDVVLRGEHVHNFPFPFVPPLESEQYVNFHWCLIKEQKYSTALQGCQKTLSKLSTRRSRSYPI